jgi:hypothetical protein
MLEANYSCYGSTIAAFRASLSETDRERLNNELDSYAKGILSAMLFRTRYEELRQMLSEKEISPLLFQWALSVRDELGDGELLIDS